MKEKLFTVGLSAALLATGGCRAEQLIERRALSPEEISLYQQKSDQCLEQSAFHVPGVPEIAPYHDGKSIYVLDFNRDGASYNLTVLAENSTEANRREKILAGLVVAWNNPAGAAGIEGDTPDILLVPNAQKATSTPRLIGSMCLTEQN